MGDFEALGQMSSHKLSPARGHLLQSLFMLDSGCKIFLVSFNIVCALNSSNYIIDNKYNSQGAFLQVSQTYAYPICIYIQMFWEKKRDKKS